MMDELLDLTQDVCERVEKSLKRPLLSIDQYAVYRLQCSCTFSAACKINHSPDHFYKVQMMEHISLQAHRAQQKPMTSGFGNL